MLVVQLHRGVYSSENAPVFDVDTTIVYSVLSFEFWALVSGLEERKREQGEILKPLSNVTVEEL